jgi:hypothetical protein
MEALRKANEACARSQCSESSLAGETGTAHRPRSIIPTGTRPPILLFCDNPDLFRSGEQEKSALATVLSGAATREALERIAADPDIESRVRMLVFNRLRAMGLPAPAKQLLGTIIEFPQRGGLDTLAAFATGGFATSTRPDIRRYSSAHRPESSGRRTR